MLVGAKRFYSSSSSSSGNVDYASILRHCAQSKNLAEGRGLHGKLHELGLAGDTYLGNLLVQMYGSCGCVDDAKQAFEQIARKNSFSWNILLGISTQNADEEQARGLFERMPQRDTVSWNAMITAFAQKGHLHEAREMFDLMQERNVVSWTSMTAAYAAKGCLSETREFFERMPQRSVVSWNVVISAYAQHGHCTEAIQVFQEMQLGGFEADKVTMIAVLDACSSIGALEMVESYAARSGLISDTMVATAFVGMYGKCECLDEAERMFFQEMRYKSVVSWNVMLTAYAQNGCVDKANALFQKMPGQTLVSWNTMISAYNSHGQADSERAASVFEAMPSRDVVSWTSIMSIFARNGDSAKAWEIFNKMPQRTAVSWNSMLSAFSQNGRGGEALQLFKEMDLEGVEADNVCFINVLSACADTQAIEQGAFIHKEIEASPYLEPDAMVASAVVNMYGKCGRVEDAEAAFDTITGKKTVVAWNTLISIYGLNSKVEEAKQAFSLMPGWSCITWTTMVVALAQNGYLVEARQLFEDMPERTMVSWNAMVTAYTQNKQGRNALELLAVMDSEGLQPNRITLVTILDACADLGALIQGQEIHDYILNHQELESDLSIRTALLNMYGKCGSIDAAQSLFDGISEHDVISWTAIITAYAQCGQGKAALHRFQEMQLEGMQANEISFVSFISACSQSSLVEDGGIFFLLIYETAEWMVPRIEHWICVIDLLGRSGKVNQAEEVVDNMPFEPDAAAWKALLGCCRIHNDSQRANRAAENVNRLDPESAASLVLLETIQEALNKKKKNLVGSAC